MATENTEPNHGLIAKIAIISIGTLIVVRIGLVSYFHYWEDKLKAESVASVEQVDLAAVRANEKSLTGSPVPIDKAIAEIEKDPTRTGTGVAPQHAFDGGMDDLRAVTDCWSRAPCDAGALFATQQQPAPAGSGPSDAGAAPADAGKAAADAQAPKPRH